MATIFLYFYYELVTTSKLRQVKLVFFKKVGKITVYKFEDFLKYGITMIFKRKRINLLPSWA